MVDNKIKTKSAMLNELESIKGLLLEEDDIPILQEVIEQQLPASENSTTAAEAKVARIIVEQQQDFFEEIKLPSENKVSALLETPDQLAQKTTETSTERATIDTLRNTSSMRPSLTKATGENPFLPEHIRSRLHGNNPPPLFEFEAAKKIARVSKPVTQLGNLTAKTGISKAASVQQEIIENIVKKIMPELEKELRQQLGSLSQHVLDDLNKNP